MRGGHHVIAFYRGSTWPAMKRVLVVGPAGLSSGGIVFAAGAFLRHRAELQAVALATGLALVAAAATYTMASMQQLLRDEACLAIRTDGVSLQLASQETVIPWDTLASARWDERRANLVLERTETEPVVVARPFARITGPELARAIEQSRRRAALGLLR